MTHFLRTINILLLTGSFILFIGAASLLTKAEDEPPPSAGTAGGETSAGAPAKENSKCVAHIKEIMEIRRAEFGEFITTHFRSDKPTSELIPTAVERFRQYRGEIKKSVNEFLSPGGTALQTAGDERQACDKVVAEDFALMKELLRAHIIANAYAKKTTRLMRRYKDLNGKLEKLNFTIAQMYGYFGALSQKLPCYATKCIKQ